MHPAEKDTLIFIPAFNEASYVGQVVKDVLAVLPESTVLVIDDGSSDGTPAAARAAGAEVASLPFNCGLGAALQSGYLWAWRNDFKYCAHLDADGQHPPNELARVLQPVWDDEVDLSLATRGSDPDHPNAYEPTLSRKIGMVLFRWGLRISSGRKFNDVTSGLRAANRKTIKLFAELYAPDYGELESLQRAVRNKLRIVEIPVVMYPRAAGESKITTWQSAIFTVKGLLVLAVGAMRSTHIDARKGQL